MLIAAPALGDEAETKPAPLPKRGQLIFEDVGFDGLDFNPSGQYMVRYRHSEGKDFKKGNTTDTLRHRARLGLAATYRDMVGGLVQLQDVRTFGEEKNTLGDFNADALDMHQAYLRVMPVTGLEIRLGRQEINYENQRIVGAVGWIEQARSFDALRMSFAHDMLKLDMFYSKVAEKESPTLNEDGNPFHPNDRDVIAANAHLDVAKEFQIGAIGLGDTGGTGGTVRYTTGGLISGKTSVGFGYGAEGYYQFGGAYGDTDHRAFMVGGNLNYTAPVPVKPFLKVFVDALSGDADPADNVTRTFAPPFATAHKFHGEMDFFLNIPVHTAQRGIVDVGGAAGLTFVKGFKGQAVFHHFRAAAEQPDGLNVFGHELDAKLMYQPWPQLKMDLLYGAFWPKEIKTDGVGNTKAEHFVYSTIDFGF